MRRALVAIVTVGLLLTWPAAALAANYAADAITTSQTTSSLSSTYLTAGSPATAPPLASDPGVWFTNIQIGGMLLAGDSLTVYLVDWQGNQVDAHTVTSLPLNYSPSVQGYQLHYVLSTGSTAGWRQSYWASVTSSQGLTTTWDVPAAPPSGPAPDATRQDIVNAVNNLGSYLQNPPPAPTPPALPAMRGYQPPPPPSWSYVMPADRTLRPITVSAPTLAAPPDIPAPPALPAVPDPILPPTEPQLPTSAPLPDAAPMIMDGAPGQDAPLPYGSVGVAGPIPFDQPLPLAPLPGAQPLPSDAPLPYDPPPAAGQAGSNSPTPLPYDGPLPYDLPPAN